MKKVSIIVPVYNVEDLLGRCVDSIIEQDYQNWELLLIDDGSNDNSGKIAEKYASRDNRIIVYHKTNGGVSSARNYGLEKATGEYILFIDADDSVANNYVSVLEASMTAENTELSVCGIVEVRSCGRVRRKIKGALTGIFIADFKSLIRLLRTSFAKIYKASIIEVNNIRFDENITYAEDEIFNFIYYRYVEKYKIVLDTEYYYYRRNGTLSDLTRLRNDKMFIGFFNKLCMEKAYYDMGNVRHKDRLLLQGVFRALFYFINLDDFSKFKEQCVQLKGLLYDRTYSKSELHTKRWFLFLGLRYEFYWLIYLYLRRNKDYYVKKTGTFKLN